MMLQLRPGGWVEMNWAEGAKMWHEKAPGRIEDYMRVSKAGRSLEGSKRDT